MIDTRERAYAERLPRADALLASAALEKLQQRNAALESELSGIEARHDVSALGTPGERQLWARVQRVEAGLAGAPETPESSEMRAKFVLEKGVLYYRLNDAYGARLWQAQRGLKDLSLVLHEAQSRWIRVERARRNMPVNTGEFATRVAALRTRIDALQVRLADTEHKQSMYLAQMAVQELQQQKDRLATYQLQARFALATMYDRAANSQAARPAPSAAPQEGPAPGDQPSPAPPDVAAPPATAEPPR
jgi:hypothetical protein